jgi:hypothetical protein
MSLSQVLEELPGFTFEERQLLIHRITVTRLLFRSGDPMSRGSTSIPDDKSPQQFWDRPTAEHPSFFFACGLLKSSPGFGN